MSDEDTKADESYECPLQVAQFDGLISSQRNSQEAGEIIDSSRQPFLTHLTRMRHLMAHRPSVAIRGCATSWRININYRFLKLYAPEVCGFVSDVSITSYLCSCRVSRM